MTDILLEKIRKNSRFAALVAGAVLIGGGIFVSSTFAGSRGTSELTIIRNHSSQAPQRRVIRRPAAPAFTPAAALAAANMVALEAPPERLAVAPSKNMVASINPSSFAAAPVQMRVQQNHKIAQRNVATRPAAVKVQKAAAPAQKPDVRQLFSMVRLLNYSPHPLNEELLKKKPLVLNEKLYWFTLRYDEDWHVINDDEGYMRGISFEIDVMEGDKVVRRMKTPKVGIDPARIIKGQILGIAEVAPYKFTISVEEFTRTRKGVSELVFKLDLVG